MAITIAGPKVQNTVFWKENEASRKKAFSNLKKYKQEIMGIKSQLTGLGNIKVKVHGLAEARSQLSKIRSDAAKVGQATAKAAGVKVAAIPTTSSFMGPVKPPVQADVKRQSIESKAANAEAKRLADIYKFGQRPALQEINKIERDRILNGLRLIKNKNELGKSMARELALLRAQKNEEKERLRLVNQRNFAQKRGMASVPQLAGGAFSIYTALQGIGAVARTGMGMQKMSASMLSVSDSLAESKENISFVRKESQRLGGDLLENTRAYTQLLANRGEISKEDTKALFTGIAELATARGLSADEVAGSVKALGQMMGKTKVMAKVSLAL